MGNAIQPEAEAPPLVLSARETVDARLEGIERFELEVGKRPVQLSAALPSGYAKARRKRFPLVLMVESGELFGSAVEMTRLLAGSREAVKCIVVNVEGAPAGDAAALGAIALECERRYRVQAGALAVYGHNGVASELLRALGKGIPGIDRYIVASLRPAPDALPASSTPARIAWTTQSAVATGVDRRDIRWKVLHEASAAGLAIPALIHGLRTFWPTNHDYGSEVMPLANPVVARIARLLAPVLRPLTRRPEFAPHPGRNVVRSQVMQRDFEVFVSLPESAGNASPRRYPAIVALDANGGFGTVSETVARLTRAGEIGEAIVIGIGTPRTQGELEFAFRRFEELSPPAPASYRWDDSIGRFFRALFALRGQDARVQLGQAPHFHEFIASELLPGLGASLPIDPTAITLLGHSAAGTFVAYALAQPDSPFSGFACLSPGVAMGGGWMLRNARTALQQRGRPARVFTALGSEELGNPFNTLAGIPRTPEWAEALGLSDLKCHVFEGETHTTVYPRAVALALRELLGK